jgi:riboflavin kinase/FMN adenylyltransferase
MRVVWGFDNPPLLRNAVATVGSYDGVHRGHRILLDEVVRRAKECDGESVVLTFEPHPRITLGNAEGLQLLSSFEEKCRLLEAVGIDCVVVIPFDEAFSRLSREEFIDHYIVGLLHIKQLVIGYNHHFGHNKMGNHTFLQQHGALEVVEVAQYTDNGSKVSSTEIRRRFAEGDVAQACQLLGHPYIIIGIADEQGRVEVDEYKLLPADGEYDCTVCGEPCRCRIEGRRVTQSCKFSEKIAIEL